MSWDLWLDSIVILMLSVVIAQNMALRDRLKKLEALLRRNEQRPR
jgi:hypothetical protein